MSTVLQQIDDNTFNYDKRLHVKGAAEIVLSSCTHFLNEGGEKVELGEEMREFLTTDVIEDFAKQALRTICFAYKDLQENEGGITHEDMHEDGFNRIVEK
jgi:magnesium-transporting ATPase (P-type)